MSVPLWRFSQCVVEGCLASRNGVLSLFLPGVAGRGHCFYTSEPVVCVLMAFSTPNLNIKNGNMKCRNYPLKMIYFTYIF